MKEKAVFPLLVSMAVPMMLSMLIQSLYNIVDSIFVARLGTDALTAVSLVYPLQNILLAVSLGTGIGISSLVAVNMGAGNKEKADQAATTGIFLTMLHAVFFIAFGLLATKPFLRLFTDNESVLSQAETYSYLVLCLSFGNLLQITMEKIFQAMGEMVATMLLLASGCIINIILDPILIFGLLGFPAMGVAGAAIATVIGQVAAFLLYLVVYNRKHIGVTIHWRALRPDPDAVKKIYAVGIPSGIMVALPSVLVSVLNGMLMRFSEVYVAVLGIYFKLQTFIYMPANGIVQGMRPIVSFNYGAGEKKRMNHAVNYSLYMAAAIMAAGTLAAQLFPEQILGIFAADSSLLAGGVPALRIISAGFLLSAPSLIYCGFFEAMGMGRESLMVSLLRQFLVIIVLGTVFSKVWGAAGIWASFPVAELLAAFLAVFLYRRAQHRISG